MGAASMSIIQTDFVYTGTGQKRNDYCHKNSYYIVLTVAFSAGAFLPFCWSIGQDTAVIYEEESRFSGKIAADSIW